MKILIADKFDQWAIDDLIAARCDVAYDPGLEGEALRDAVRESGCNLLIVRSTKVPARVIEASPGLGLILRAGAGYNNIDVAAASGHGVLVANCPGKNAVAVAELTFALILALDRRLVENAADLRRGVWNKKEYAKARGLKGRTLGLIGMGRIGQHVARRARAFEMDVVAQSRSLTSDRASEYGVERCETPAEVASRCDILSIHLAAAPETEGLIDAAVLDRLAPGSYVINTARHDVMDYAALARAIEQRNLRVGLDVYPGEPSVGRGEFTDAIVKAGGIVYGTHHIGASTDQAQQAIAEETIRIVKEFAATGRAPNTVNLAARTPAKCRMVVRHHNTVGVLAAVLDCISRADINVQEMSNTILQEHRTAVASIRLAETPDDEVIRSIADMKDKVIQVDVKPI